MGCKCISEVSKKVEERLKTMPEYAHLKITSISFDNIAFQFSGVSFLNQPMTICHEPVGRKTKTPLNFKPTFCPLCGKRYDEPDEVSNDQ